MMMNTTMAQLRTLKLEGMACALQDQLTQASMTAMSFEERLTMLVDREVHVRDDKRKTRLLKQAHLKYPQACIEDIDTRPGRGLERKDVMSLALGEWVQSGHAVLITGPTGAGKSTCFACLAGQQVPSAGQVTWQGHSLLGQSPAQRQQLGVARTFQVAQTFEALTALQNIQLVLRDAPPLAWWDSLSQRQPERAMTLLAQVGLHPMAQATVADLPYGAKKRLELAMALAGLPAQAHDALLLLDEPAAGLALAERAEMMALVRQVAALGVTVLYTEHNMDAVFGVADRVMVLMQGRLVADGTPESVAQDPQVLKHYLGTDFKTPPRADAPSPPGGRHA